MNEISQRQKIREELSSVPELQAGTTEAGLLAAYAGERPPYPAWALTALDDAPERLSCNVQGARIEVLVWGALGAPGVLLLHGNGAHAGWWSFIAPFLAKAGYRVAAFSFSGMGGSDWREHYSIECFIEEIFASIEVAGLAASGQAPILAAHSFGGSPAFMAAMARPDEVGGLILLDSGIDIPGEEWKGPPKRTAPNRVYPTLEMALARFRLAPPQPCENHWALDHIARTSLKEVEGGWTWQFDPFLWNGFSPPVLSQVAPDLPVPAFVVRGAHSYLADDRLFDYMKSILPKGTGFVTVPEAQHHLLLDQPLATISTLEACLAGFAILRNRAMRG